jgi:UDP-glucose 4-epimerase
MAKVIVFGGSGFLGSHVADALTDAGHNVTIYDLVKSTFLKKGQTMIEGDILDKAAVVKACADQQFVYNFAGLADIDEAKLQPELTAKLNIMGNLNILEAAKQNNSKRFIFASTVYVYSEAGSFYRASKQASEKFVELYGEQYGMDFTILRYGSLYGRRADKRNNIYRLIESALNKQEIVYRGSGEELREYVHVQDAAQASVDILDDKHRNQYFIVTGTQAMRIKDVMLMIAEMLGNKVKLKFDPEDTVFHYNITPYSYKPKLGKKFTVNPFVDFGQGILDCIQEQDAKPKGK